MQFKGINKDTIKKEEVNTYINTDSRKYSILEAMVGTDQSWRNLLIYILKF